MQKLNRVMMFLFLASALILSKGWADLIPGDEFIRKTTWLQDGGQDRIYYKNNKEVAREARDRSGHMIKKDGIIPDGIYKDDSWHREISYKNGLENGSMKTYGEDGILGYEHEMKDGRPIKLKAFSPDGKIISEAIFNDDGTSVERIYNQSGQLVKINNSAKKEH
ncbi:MAG: hypothetical protein WCI27_04305 [Candidatus Omnitrophota bacterium]